jgi:predicted phosphodiesterase
MVRILHISDLHFGREDARAVEALQRLCGAFAPSLIIVTGDLTQRATRQQFLDAHAFLDRLAAPWVTVPGNHDIPLFDLAQRLATPFARYRRHIAPAEGELMTSMSNRFGIGLHHLQSATPYRWKQGVVQEQGIALLRSRISQQRFRVQLVLSHHPFAGLETDRDAPAINGETALRNLADAAPCIIWCSGHLHRPALFVRPEGQIFSQPGTSCAQRVGPQGHAAHCMVIDRSSVSIESWQRAVGETDFAVKAAERYSLSV